MKKSLFTLIEMLVIVAILGILVTILLPSLSKAREKAKTAVCMSNLKQIGFAFMNYTSKNNGQIPINKDISSGKERTWDDHLAGYDGREVPDDKLDGWIPHSYKFDQYICPADTSPKHNARHKRSYSINHGVKNPNANSKKRHFAQFWGWLEYEYEKNKPAF